MIIKVAASIVCDQCSAEIPCVLPVEAGEPVNTYAFKKPILSSGLTIIERYGYPDVERFLCDKCAGERGHEKCPKCGKYKEYLIDLGRPCYECRGRRA